MAARRILNGGELAPADLPGRDLPAVLRLAPRLPVRPPRARMLLCGFKLGPELAHRRPIGPVLISVPRRRVDHPSDMARAGNNKPDGATQELRT